MPTQEELNAAQMELDIANDNYAAMANRYNKFQDLFKAYAKASPEMQDKAAESIWYALEEFEKLKLDMYAAEDRIQQAQNAVNSYNELLAQQPVQQPVVRSNYNSGRRNPTNNESRLGQYLNNWYYVWNDNLVYTPSGVKVEQNWYNLNNEWEFVESPETEQPLNQTQATSYINNPINLNLRRWITPTYNTSASVPVSTPSNGYYKSNTLRWILWNAWRNLNNFWQMTKGSFRNMNNALNKASDTTGKFLIWTPQRQL